MTASLLKHDARRLSSALHSIICSKVSSLRLGRIAGLFAISLAAFIGLNPFAAKAQKGPGGVSLDGVHPTVPRGSTCRIWLDASNITTIADGDPVLVWNDISQSLINDAALGSDPNFLPPYFRDNPAYSINGYPVITFDEGRMFKLNSTLDLNTEATTTYKQTIFVAFRTSSDIASRQILWEEGGNVRGFNIFILNGELYMGAYDQQSSDNDIGWNSPTFYGKVPGFGYSYIKTPIQANTTYIATFIYDVPTNNTLTTNASAMRGYINGIPFESPIIHAPFPANQIGSNQAANPGVGGVFRHPDPIGIGGINSDSVNELGRVNNQTGNFPFNGMFAELCYYAYVLNEAERIIVENYLGTKYFATLLANDRYSHKISYSAEVIGIGQQANAASERHNLSQGTTPFLISAPLSEFNQANEYFMMGHNRASMIYTNSGVPGNDPNTMRLQRIWRVDETGELGNINMKIDLTKLPAAPTGFTRLVLLVDESGQNFPNFGNNSTVVREIPLLGGHYQLNYNFSDNSFFTLGWIKPTINFTLSEDFGLEGNPPPDSSLVEIDVELNFTPALIPGNTFTANYFFVDQTALRASDYGYSNTVQQAGVTFGLGQRSAKIPMYIKNDLLPEDPATETLLIVLEEGSNTTPGLSIGQRDTLTYSIYDDDPPPKVSFASAATNVNEGAGSATVTVVRSGSTAGSASLRVGRVPSPNEGNATYNIDYTMPSPNWAGSVSGRYHLVSFAPGESTKSVNIPIVDDEIDEFEETIRLRLTNLSGVGIDGSSILQHTINITDNDPEPIATFLTNNSAGFESIGEPIIFVHLDRQSAKEVEVDYEILPESTASSTTDYTAANPGTVYFPAMDTLAYPTIYVSNTDETPEPDETVVFKLSNPVNATLGNPDQHIYTIIDYAPFEWRGAGGVGRDSDNILWVDADRMSGSHNQNFQTISNYTPWNINITQNNSAERANLQTTSNLINGRKTLHFDGNSFYTVSNHPRINLSGFVSKKAFFMVIRTGPSVSARQLIYEQGAGTRGLSIYIEGNRLHFNGWNLRNDGPESPWGGLHSDNYNTTTLRRYASSYALSPNTNYIVSCHFDKDASEKMVVYVNGRKGERVETQACGRIYAHTGAIGLGGISNAARFHTLSSVPGSGFGFNGYLAEFIKFDEPQMNEARRITLENYLSAKYNIALHPDTRQVFDLSYADFSNPAQNFGYDVAGIGAGANTIDDVHLDAQGRGQLRIRAPQTISSQSFMNWGHNAIPLQNTYPFSNYNIPPGVIERSGRVWRINKEGTVSNVDVLINFSASDNAALFVPEDLKLLRHSGPDPQNFSNADVIAAHAINSGYVVEFKSLNFNDGDFIALASMSSIVPLPIELLAFDAQLKGSHVDLRWTTASETNNDYFVVERCRENLVWHEVATVAGAGNSNTLLHYDAIDTEPIIGLSYYRLKQVDYDGSFSYSEIVPIVNTQTEMGDLIILFPNPSFDGKVYLKLPYAYSEYPCKIRIYDMKGRVAWQGLSSGNTDIEMIHFGRLSPGVYIMEISSALVHESKKFVVE